MLSSPFFFAIPLSIAIKAVTAEDKPGAVDGDLQAPLVSVTSPAAGAKVKVGAQHAITWTATDNVGVVARAIHLNTNNGSTWTKVDSAAGNTGVYQWAVPSAASKQCIIRVTAYDSAGNAGKKESGVFEIEPTVAVLDPERAGDRFRLTKTPAGLMLYSPFSGGFSASVTDIQGRIVSRCNAAGNGRWCAIANAHSSSMHIVSIKIPGKTAVTNIHIVR